MNTFKIDSGVPTDMVSDWIKNNDMFERISFDWVKKHLVFEHDEDAVAFSLRFKIRRVDTKLDIMLQNEESNN